jgi:tight adherence protein C
MGSAASSLIIPFLLGAISLVFILFAIWALFLRRDIRAERVKLVTNQATIHDKLKQDQSIRQQARLRQRTKKGINFMRNVLERFQLQRLAASKNLKFRLAAAGLRHPSAPIAYVFSRFGAAAAAVVVVLLFAGLAAKFSSSGLVHSLIIAVAAAAGYFLPAILITNWTQQRKQSMTLACPDMLDMLVICVESGLSVGAAFTRVTEEFVGTSPVLSRELALLSAELMFLGNRRTAYQNFADRTGLAPARSLATTLIQSDRYGTPLGAALKVLAQEYRDERMSRAEKKAASLPSKLSVPMVLFFMPSLFLVILGPPVLEIFLK